MDSTGYVAPPWAQRVIRTLADNFDAEVEYRKPKDIGALAFCLRSALNAAATEAELDEIDLDGTRF